MVWAESSSFIARPQSLNWSTKKKDKHVWGYEKNTQENQKEEVKSVEKLITLKKNLCFLYKLFHLCVVEFLFNH